MSLINDALRRANPKGGNSVPSVGLGASLQHVEYGHRRSSWLYLLAWPLAIGLFSFAAWLLWTAGKPTPKMNFPSDALTDRALQGNVAATRDKPLPMVKHAPLIPPGKTGAAPQINAKLGAHTNFAVQASSPSTALSAMKMTQEARPILPAPAEGTRIEVPFPKLKLQGIYFRRTNPSVLINGRTLFIGDRVEGTRVVTIDRQTVTVEFGGQISLLTL